MKRPAGYLSLLLAFLSGLVAWLLGRLPPGLRFLGPNATGLAAKAALGIAVLFFGYGAYMLVSATLARRSQDKRRLQNVRNVVRLVVAVATTIGLFAVLTEQWVGLLFSVGVVGFAITFALQQPLFSLIGWMYILVKQPYQIGDRVAIEGSKGDVVEVDLFVTTLWEINGELVTSHQPSGRIVTVPNSVVLSSHVTNYTRNEFPFVWNELSIQVAYETDLEFARQLMAGVADDYLGDEMAGRIADYRQRLSETAVELEVQDRPTVNVRQQESWVELRLRYLVHPRRGQRVRNALYDRILEEFQANADRVKFPVSRNR